MTARLDRFGLPGRSTDRFRNAAATPSQLLGSSDATACDREPIHIPGSVQPHGALLALDEATLSVRRASANVAEFLGAAPESLIGAPLAQGLGVEGAEAVRAAVRGADGTRVGPLVRELAGLVGDDVLVRPCDLTLHRSPGGLLLLEIEESLPAVALAAGDIPQTMLKLHAAPDLGTLLQVTADEVAGLTGFDRVMVYRFNREGDGEVVAEHARTGSESYLGLHYPGSDIPRQARDLYRRQWLRLIADSSYTAAPLLPLTGSDESGAPPIDLSFAALRSVSPVHLQYLRNMGVGASMSMSIVVDDELWGLILCHAAERHLVPSQLRTACEQVAQFVSLQVGARRQQARLEEDLRSQHLRVALLDQMVAPEPVRGLVGTVGPDGTPNDVELRDLIRADVAAARIAGTTAVDGDLLSAETADRLVALLRAGSGDGGFVSHSLRLDLPEAADLLVASGSGALSGALLAPGPRAGDDDYLLWLRREVEQTVDWAGEPSVKHQAGDLSPRASFALWREKVRDHAEPWDAGDPAIAARVAEAVAGRLARLEEMSLAAAAARAQQLFAREHEIADTLQRSMLPVLPDIDGLDLSASYATASESAEVGGDWYDVFTLPDGTTGIAIGDVTGHDVSAAAVMGQLRSVLRSYAWEQTSPEQVLDKLDALVAGFEMRHLATVFFARLERGPEPGGTLLRYANAGHLPPVLRLPDGSVEILDDAGSVLIGVGLDIPHVVAERLLPPGSTLLLYTDGLVERRDRPVGTGIEELQTVVAAGPDDVDRLREYVLTSMVPGRREDDIAVLVVRLSGEAPSAVGR